MNIFNRFLAVIGLIIIALVGAFALIFPSWTLAFMHSAADIGHNLFGETTWVLRQIIRTIAAILFLGLMGLLIWLELRQPNQKTVEVTNASGGRVRVASNDIQQRLTREVENLNGVISAKVTVSARNKGIHTQTDAVIMPDADGAGKGDEIAQTIRSIAEQQIGVKLLTKPQVNVKIGKVKTNKLKDLLTPATANTSAGSTQSTSLPALPAETNTEKISPTPNP